MGAPAQGSSVIEDNIGDRLQNAASLFRHSLVRWLSNLVTTKLRLFLEHLPLWSQ